MKGQLKTWVSKSFLLRSCSNFSLNTSTFFHFCIFTVFRVFTVAELISNGGPFLRTHLQRAHPPVLLFNWCTYLADIIIWQIHECPLDFFFAPRYVHLFLAGKANPILCHDEICENHVLVCIEEISTKEFVHSFTFPMFHPDMNPTTRTLSTKKREARQKAGEILQWRPLCFRSGSISRSSNCRLFSVDLYPFDPFALEVKWYLFRDGRKKTMEEQMQKHNNDCEANATRAELCRSPLRCRYAKLAGGNMQCRRCYAFVQRKGTC